MFASLFRLLSFVILAGGVIVAIIDATHWVAENSLRYTNLGETLQTYWPSAAEWLRLTKMDLIETKISTWPLSNVIDYINSIPVALLAAALFLLIYGLASRNRAPRHF